MRRLVALLVAAACGSPPAAHTPPPSNTSQLPPPRAADPEPVAGCIEYDTENPACPDELIGRIIKVEAVGADVTITIALGSEHGVTRSWSGEVLDAGTDIALPGGSLTLVRIDKRVTQARTRLPAGQLTANPSVRLRPPP